MVPQTMKPKVELLERGENRLRLLFENAPLHIMSSMRRAALEEVPTLAIDTVFIVENNSVIHDENLAHRLAMIPLKSDFALEKYRSPEECRECPACEDCYTRLVLDVKNEDKDEMVVYSGDLKSEDPEIVPVHDKIPIVVLGRGQSVSLEAQARLGRGKEHIKWSPATISVLTHLPRIIVEDRPNEACIECIGYYFKELAKELSDGFKGEKTLANVRNTGLIRYCIDHVCGGSKSPVKIEYLKDKLIWTVESSGSLRPERIVLESVRILRKKIGELTRALDSE